MKYYLLFSNGALHEMWNHNQEWTDRIAKGITNAGSNVVAIIKVKLKQESLL